MAKMFQVYGIGQALIPVLPPPQSFANAPNSSQTNYEVGQLAYTPGPSATEFYIYGGGGNWIQITDSDGPVQSVTGTANQILATPTTGDVVLSLIGPYTPATYTAHGVLVGEGSSSIVALAVGTTGQVLIGSTGADPAFGAIGTNSGLTNHGVLIAQNNAAFVATSAGTAGQFFVSGGAGADPTWTTATFPTTAGASGTILRSNGTNYVASTDTWPDTVVAGDILIATSANVVGSLADVATGQVLMSGGVGVAPAYSGSPSVSGSLTAGTTVTATLGAITATNGDFVGSTSGTGILLNSPSASGAAASPVEVNGRSGRATFTSVSIAAAADLTLTLTNSSITASTTILMVSMSGATTGSALSIKSITNSAGSSAIVVTNGTGATTSTADIQIDFLVVNA